MEFALLHSWKSALLHSWKSALIYSIKLAVPIPPVLKTQGVHVTSNLFYNFDEPIKLALPFSIYERKRAHLLFCSSWALLPYWLVVALLWLRAKICFRIPGKNINLSINQKEEIVWRRLILGTFLLRSTTLVESLLYIEWWQKISTTHLYIQYITWRKT